jgi:serine/threonine protein phosphatase PrpC
MLMQRNTIHSTTASHSFLRMFTGVHKPADAGRPELRLLVGSALDPGIIRKDKPNEDSILVTHGFMASSSDLMRSFALFVEADGMGGQAYGQIASQMAVQSLVKYISESLSAKERTPEDFLPRLTEGVQYANSAVHSRNREQFTNMGTTMTAVLVIDNTAYVAHVGDSRCYLLREPDGLSQITQDHSAVAALVAAGSIRPEDIYTHPMRNMIYRCLGERSSVKVDTYTIPLVAGDKLLLCSDGLWEMVRDPQIEAILATPTQNPPQTAHALIQAALTGGGEDNVSAIVVQVSRLKADTTSKAAGEK